MAEIYPVLWSLAVHAAEHHDGQLVGDSLRYIEPVQLGVGWAAIPPDFGGSLPISRPILRLYDSAV